jgi:adenylosuccinate lyase
LNKVMLNIKARRTKDDGAENDLLARLASDPAFEAVAGEIAGMVVPERFVGRSREQVEQFLDRHVAPVLERHRDALSDAPDSLRV